MCVASHSVHAAREIIHHGVWLEFIPYGILGWGSTFHFVGILLESSSVLIYRASPDRCSDCPSAARWRRCAIAVCVYWTATLEGLAADTRLASTYSVEEQPSPGARLYLRLLSSRFLLSPRAPAVSLHEARFRVVRSDETFLPVVLHLWLADCVWCYVIIFQISENDDLPTNVCRKCMDNVNNWHIFKTVCEKAQNKLESLKKGGSQLEEVGFLSRYSLTNCHILRQLLMWKYWCISRWK